MKRLFITAFILLIGFIFYSPSAHAEQVQARVVNVGKTGFISNGLYFRINEVVIAPKNISVVVQAKNKFILSQALYVELVDDKGGIFVPENKESVVFFKPLKFNKPITQKLSFDVSGNVNNCWLVVYSRDIFKKNKKQMITKLSLNEAKKELNSK